MGVLGLAASLTLLMAAAAPGQFPIRQAPTHRRPYAPHEAFVSRSETPTAAETPHPAIARITVPEKDGVSYGSGTLIDARGQFGLVVTNWHVVRDAAGTITVEFPEGHKTAAQVVRTDKDWDLAALSIYRPKAEPLSVTGEPPRVGELLTIAGYGSGQYRTAAGPLSQYVAPSPDFPEEFLDLAAVEARHGDSGGPILNQRGEVCGVLFGSAPGYTIGAYGGRVRQFLATVIPGGQPGSDAQSSLANLAANSPPLTPPTNRLPIDTNSPASAPSSAPADANWTARADAAAPNLNVTLPQATALHQPPSAAAPGSSAPYSARSVEKEEADRLTPAMGSQQLALLEAPPPRSPDDGQIDRRAAVDRLETSASASQLAADGDLLMASSRLHSPLPLRMGATKTSGVDVSQAPPDQLLAAAWKKLGGSTLFDQTKAVLAIIGVLAVAAQLWRFSSRAEEPGDE